jgi:ubiquinone/menaquinone biosynthesis C-methylase UbiE
MAEPQRKTQLKETFDTVAGGDDGAAIRIFPESAQSTVSLLNLRGDERALDVACGTGHASASEQARDRRR